MRPNVDLGLWYSCCAEEGPSPAALVRDGRAQLKVGIAVLCCIVGIHQHRFAICPAGRAKKGKVERSKLAWKQEHRRRHLAQVLLRGDSIVLISAMS